MEVIDIDDGTPCPRYLWLRLWAEVDRAFPLGYGEHLFTSKAGKLCALYTLSILLIVTIALFLFKPATRLMC